MEFLDPVRDWLGGGSLTLWTIIAGLVVVWLAFKIVSFGLKVLTLIVAVAMFVSVAPWSGEDVDNAPARCAAAAVEEAAEGWRTVLTKRITVDQVSEGAECADGDIGLASGDAVVKLRTFYDLPFQTWDVTADGAAPRFETPELDTDT
ncbi:MAG: hypothetical protein R3320_00955 [Nitriliruptorales bacterium]|nr:hypothetical protein [Nitriliruptorales bacterium]